MHFNENIKIDFCAIEGSLRKLIHTFTYSIECNVNVISSGITIVTHRFKRAKLTKLFSLSVAMHNYGMTQTPEECFEIHNTKKSNGN